MTAVSGTAKGGCPQPLPLPPTRFSREIGGGISKAPSSLGHLRFGAPSSHRPQGCRPRLGCPNVVLMNSEAAAVKDLAGTGFSSAAARCQDTARPEPLPFRPPSPSSCCRGQLRTPNTH